jgi:hypothetical protein
MHKVERMTQTPAQCLYCGRGNTPDDPDTLDEFWAIDLERDVNWGDPTYLCKYCCDILAAQAGYVTMDQLQEQMNINQAQSRKLHDLTAKLEQRQRRLDQIATGDQARARVKKTTPPATETKKSTTTRRRSAA